MQKFYFIPQRNTGCRLCKNFILFRGVPPANLCKNFVLLCAVPPTSLYKGFFILSRSTGYFMQKLMCATGDNVCAGTRQFTRRISTMC